MFFKHQAFEDPKNDSLKLWRYIELEKFISLMETSELYFCRADYFRNDDPFEGTFPKVEYDNIVKHQGKDVARNLFEITSKDTFINCWHLSDFENLAMWRLYSRNDKGIALQTDIQSFKESFENSDKEIFAGKVQYIDYEKDYFYGRSEYDHKSGNGFTAYIHKRIIYDYEKEYRAICTDPNDGINKKGIKIKVILNKLIHNIYLAPNSIDANYKLVTDIVKNICNDINVMRSSFNSTPYL